MKHFQFVVCLFLLAVALPSNADAQRPSSRGESKAGVSFVNDIAPIINAKCGKCHVRSAKGRYDIKSFRALMSSDSIELNRPEESYFIEVIENGEMPKGGLKVEREELAMLKKWIKEGAKFDGKNETQAINSFGDANGGNARGAQKGSTPGRVNGQRQRPGRGKSSGSSAFDSNALLKFLDSDGNGELSLKEIDAAKRLLYSLDANKDNRLTGDEVRDLGNK